LLPGPPHTPTHLRVQLVGSFDASCTSKQQWAAGCPLCPRTMSDSRPRWAPPDPSQRLLRLARGGAAVERVQHPDRLQADLLVGAVLVPLATARRDEVLQRLGAVAALLEVLHQEALRDVARTVVQPELETARARLLVVAAVHEHALRAEHLDVELLARRHRAVRVARPARAA
jgi:hypothetical protein